MTAESKLMVFPSTYICTVGKPLMLCSWIMEAILGSSLLEQSTSVHLMVCPLTTLPSENSCTKLSHSGLARLHAGHQVA